MRVVLPTLFVCALQIGCAKDKPLEAAPAGAPPGASQAQSPVASSRSQPKPLSSSISMADKEASYQLLEGFHAIEDSAWRWTGKRFSVDLATPQNAKEKGATLRLKLNVPEAAADKYGAISMSAKLDGLEIPAKKYEKPGNYQFTAEIPAASVQGDRVRIEFLLDKSFLPGGVDQRELGVIVSHVALEPK